MHFASASPLSGSASPRETPSRFGRNRPESIYADPERKRVGKPVLLYALDGKENGLSSPFHVVCGVPIWMQTGRKTRSPLRVGWKGERTFQSVSRGVRSADMDANG